MFREVQVGQVFFGNACHVERNRLVAEVAVMCKKAGIEENPLDAPEVMDDVVRRLRLTEPCFYFAGELKRVNDYERNKIRLPVLPAPLSIPVELMRCTSTARKSSFWEVKREVYYRCWKVKQEWTNCGYTQLVHFLLEFLIFQTILLGCFSCDLPECFRIVAGGCKMKGICNMRNRKPGTDQH